MVYIEQNPCSAKMVPHAWDWRWSSARAHLGLLRDDLVDLSTGGSRTRYAQWSSAAAGSNERLQNSSVLQPLGLVIS